MEADLQEDVFNCAAVTNVPPRFHRTLHAPVSGFLFQQFI